MATTARGHIEKLPSGSFRVHVYAGTDPVTGKPRRLKQTCPDEASAAVTLGRLLAQADGDRFPDREATLGQALAKYLEVADLEVSTREAHEGYIRRTIGPVLGEEVLAAMPAATADRALMQTASMLVTRGAVRCVTIAPPVRTSATIAAVHTCADR
jgi:integrase